jgi:hypothetical protein
VAESRPTQAGSLGAASIDAAPRERERNDQKDRARKGTRGMSRSNLARPWLILGAALLVGVLLAGVAMAQTSKPSAKPPLKQFKMVRSQSAAAVKGGKCLKNASKGLPPT